MKTLRISLLASAVVVALAACGGGETERASVSEADLSSDDARQSYALGANIGSYISSELEQHQEVGIELDEDLMVSGFIDALEGNAVLSEEEAEELVFTLRERFTTQQSEVVGGRNIEEGMAYQEENAARDGVMVTESGLQYEVLESGDGESPAANDIVEVHYEGTLIDGTVFDSSYERDEPISFPLNRVIPGWTEGVQLMQIGAKYRFVIPAELAYGDRQVAGGLIQPNSTLIFEVELLDVIPAEAAAENELN